MRVGEEFRKMARLKRGSRRLVLLTAFMSVISLAGGMLGAVTGAVVVLLLRSMFGVSTGIPEFMIATILFGASITFVIGLLLTMERPRWLSIRSGRGVPVVASVAVVSVVQSSDTK